MPNPASLPLLQSAATREAAMIAAQTTLADWANLIRAEYLEVPGLHLTRAQVLRLWGLDAITGDALLEILIEARFLRRTQAGAYVRADHDDR